MWKLACILAFAGVAAGLSANAAQSDPAGHRQPAHAQPARASTPVTFQDSVGEDAAAPDITSVVVSYDAAGLITFQVNIANRPALTRDMDLSIFLDTDANAATGDPSVRDGFGEDYTIDLLSDGVGLGKWNGTDDDYKTPQSSLTYSYSAAGATIKVNTSDLGGTSTVPQAHTYAFIAQAVSGIVWTGDTADFTNVYGDRAPDAGHGAWSFEVKTSPVSQLRLVTELFGTYPKHPKAPGQLDVYVNVRRLDTGAQVRSGQVACQAKVGTRSLPAPGGFYKGTVNCNWALPKWTRGKTLTGSITVTLQGATVTRKFSVNIG